MYRTLYAFIAYKYVMLLTILLVPFIDKWTVFNSINKVTKVADYIMNLLMEEPLNHRETPGRQIKQSNQLSLAHQDDCNTRMDIK